MDDLSIARAQQQRIRGDEDTADEDAGDDLTAALNRPMRFADEREKEGGRRIPRQARGCHSPLR